jgi:hypothetical protein
VHDNWQHSYLVQSTGGDIQPREEELVDGGEAGDGGSRAAGDGGGGVGARGWRSRGWQRWSGGVCSGSGANPTTTTTTTKPFSPKQVVVG